MPFFRNDYCSVKLYELAYSWPVSCRDSNHGGLAGTFECSDTIVPGEVKSFRSGPVSIHSKRDAS